MALGNGEKDQITQGLVGTTHLLLIVSECHQKVASDPTAATKLVKNKIQLSKFKDKIGFIQQLVNQAVSHLENRKEL